MDIISCENLSVSYDKLPVISNLSFTVSEGDYICIVGENGSGKSTLIKCLLGLKIPDKGHIITEKSLFEHIGYLPQQTAIQSDFPATVFEVVLSGFLNSLSGHLFFKKAHKNKVLEMLDLFGISDIKDDSFRYLSGGQKQRVLLARAMCATHRLLLLDEPITGLDPIASAEFYSLMRKINKENKITVIMVSHSIDTALAESNKILHFNDNGSYFFGTTKEYAQSDFCKRFVKGEK